MAPLKLNGLDHIVRVVPDLAPASEALARLGIVATPPGPVGASGALNTCFQVGPAETAVTVEFLSLAPDRMGDPGNARMARLIGEGGGMSFLGFDADDLAPARAAFADGGFDEQALLQPGEVQPIRWLRPAQTGLGCDVVILQHPPGSRTAGAGAHELPLLRVDHVAVVTYDLETVSRRWTDLMGAERTFAGQAFGVDIHKVRIGDAEIELLTPGATGGLAGAAAGLRPTVSFEVPNLEAVMADVRARGFKVAEPTHSPLGDRKFTTIAPRQTAGLVFQFLQRL